MIEKLRYAIWDVLEDPRRIEGKNQSYMAVPEEKWDVLAEVYDELFTPALTVNLTPGVKG